MDDALNIAMDYLIRTGQGAHFREAQTLAANITQRLARGREEFGDKGGGTKAQSITTLNSGGRTEASRVVPI